MTTTQNDYDPQAHASDTEMAIAHLYAAAEHSLTCLHRERPYGMCGEHTIYVHHDATMDALENLCKTTGSSISLVLDVAKTLR